MGQPWIAPDAPATLPRPAVRRIGATRSSSGSGPLRGSPVERLQPRGVGSILDAGFEVLRFRFPLIAAVTVTLVAPLAGIPLAVRVLRVSDRVDDISNVRFNLGIGPDTAGQGVSTAIQWLGSALALALVGLAVSHLLGAWMRGVDPGYGDVMRLVARRGPVVLAAWVLALLPKALGFLACGVGAVFTVAMFVVLSPVVASEAVGPFAALTRTVRLSAGRRAAKMMGLVLAQLAVGVAIGLIASAAGALLRSSVLHDPSWGWAVVAALQLAGALILVPVQAAWASLAYLDLRVQAEGLDVVLEMDRVFSTDGARGVR